MLSPSRGFGRSRSRAGLAAAAVLALVTGLVVFPATPAEAATFTLTAARASSGTSAADAAALCPTQGTPTAASHCAGYDTSLLAIDQILRAGDTANVRFDFSVNGADTGVVLVATLPLIGGSAAAVWMSIPAACANGSTRTDSNRTLNCVIAPPAGPTDGSVTATLRLEPAAQDGFTFTVGATIDSATSSPVASTGGATFTSSSAPFWNLSKLGGIPNTVPVPFPYNSPTGEPGFAVPSTTFMQPAKIGGYSPLAEPVTWLEDTSTAAGLPEGTRLLNWGNYGNGCGRDRLASIEPNPGYVNTVVAITNQLNSPAPADMICRQPGGPNTPIEVTWDNPSATLTYVNIWTMLWVPLSEIPAGNSTIPLRTIGFSADPVDIFGVSNYLAGTEPTTDNQRTSGTIVNQDNRTFDKYATSDASPTASSSPGSISTITRGAFYQSVMRFTNTGTVAQDPVQICDIFDSTVSRLTPFASGAYAVAVTRGPAGDLVLAPPYHPAAGYNNTSNFAVDPGAYIVEFAVGDFEGAVPTPAPQSSASMLAADCSDGGNATGWHSDPNDPAILDYAAARGLSDPFDVINRVRITFVDGPVLSGSYLAVKVRFQARTTFRDSTTEAGETILATTKLGDYGAFDYPQSTVAAWSKSGFAGPVIVGSLGVRVTVAKSATPTNVQAGAPGLDTTTYTISPRLQVGEDVSTIQPVRVVEYLPYGMRYVVGSASRAPSAIVPQSNGSTVLVWDLGPQTGVTNTNVVLPSFTFRAQADPLAPTPADNYNVVVIESVAPDGTALDTTLPIVACGTFPSVTIPPTEFVPVETTTQIPLPANYSGCEGQGRFRRFDWQTVVIGNAFLELGAAKTALSTQIEPNSADAVGGNEVGWDLTIKNVTSNTLGGVDIIDVLPHPGDGRSPESDFSGTIGLTGLTTGDTLSVAPNALPTSPSGPFPPRAGTTFYVTSASAGAVAEDPYDASNLQGGSTQWCLLADIGDPGCPATLATATAFRVISGSLATQAERSVRIGVVTNGNAEDDLYNNDAAARAIGLTSLVSVTGAAFVVVASEVTGTVWVDANGDGVIGGSEGERLEGVDVRITGSANDGGAVDVTVQTGADGLYTLPNLQAGSYTVTVDQVDVRAINPAYAITYDPDSGTTSPDGTFAVTLGLDSQVNLRNFGFATQSLTGTVYDDIDNDGVLDGGESGNDGVTVTLTGLDDLGNAVNESVVTSGGGVFDFEDIRPGTYTLTKTQLSSTLPGKNAAGTAGGTAGAPGTNEITSIEVEAAENGVNYLFGELVPEVISGVVYVDDDNNGVQDPGEPGIPNVTVHLTGTDGDGPVDQERVTLADGTFTFTDLRAGTYELSEEQPSAYLTGVTATNGAPGTVSGDTISDIEVDGDPATETRGYSFGEIPPASVSGVVYHDVNANGAQDPGEPGIANAKIDLDGVDDLGATVSLTMTTGPDGSYEFTQIRPGTYTITETEATGYLDGRETAGGAGGVVDNSAPGSNTISDIPVGVGAVASDNLFGDVLPSSLAGAVFEDDDNDGVQDPGEAGISGVSVTLTGVDDFGAPVGVLVVTLSDGGYVVPGLRPGTYSLTESQPAGYFDGIDTAGTAGGTVGADTITAIALDSGTTATGYLFAERPGVSLAGLVFSDLDGDDVQDAGEPGIEGVTIDLLDSGGGTIGTIATIADGSWEFGGLEPGLGYGVRETQPAGYVNGASVPGTAGGTAEVDEITGIVLAADASGYLFAEIALAAIRGTVWHDANDNGVIDPGETPIAGVEITLSGASDATATTGADGTYLFADLTPGTYTVTQTQPDNWADGLTIAGTEGGTVSKNSVSDIVLGPDTFADGYDFGEREAELQIFVATQTLAADVAPGPYVPVGDPVRWTYAVVNNGDTTLSGLVVTDSEIGEITCPDTTLSPDETIVCEANGTAVAGQYENTASASAAVVPSDGGGIVLFEVVEVQASDLSHYFGMLTTATIDVTVNGEDATTSPGPVFPSGSRANVVVTILNTGNVPLTLDDLETAGLGSLDCAPPGPIPPGDEVECTTSLDPGPGNYAFVLSALLVGPLATAVDGATTPTGIEIAGEAFFQLLEPGVVPSMPGTGVDVSGGWIAVTLLAILLGVLLLLVRSRSREDVLG